MADDAPRADDDAFAISLASFQKEIVGNPTPTLAGDVPTDLKSEATDWLKRAQDCLRLLARVWPQPETDANQPVSLTEGSALSPSRVGRFEIVRELGRGAFGVVFLAIDPALGRNIALKLPRPQALMTASLRRRFLREAQLAASLKHPSLVTVYETGEAGPICYIAEEFCEGQTLAAWLRDQSRPMSPRQSAGLVAQLAEAIEYAHEQGILHRDLKPSNVLLELSSTAPTGGKDCDTEQLPFVPKITDFGIAKMIEAESDETHTGGILGTPAYMAPEQADGRIREISRQTDVYSLGVILYEMLTGRPPFSGETDLETLRRISAEEPVPPRRLCQTIPRDLEAICVRCLEKRPANRYATAAALADDLNRFLAGQSTHARPLGMVRRTLKWGRRRPALAALAAISVLSLVALLIGGWWHAASLQAALVVMERLRLEADQQRTAAVEQERLAREGEERIRQHLYVGDMRLAYAAWNNSQVAETVRLLSRHRPTTAENDLRSFVWYYLQRLCDSDSITLRGHAGEIYCVAYSPDGRLLATGSQDRTVKLWEAATGRERATLRGQANDVDAVAFSPDGKTLASAGEDATIRLWDVGSGQTRTECRGHAGVIFTLDFAPDGKTLASGGDDQVVRLWDPATGNPRQTLRGHCGRIRALAYSPDGTKLATASGDGDAKVWDLRRGVVQTTFTGHRWADGSHEQLIVLSVTFSHDGRSVASSGEDHAVRIWDATTGQEKAAFRSNGEVAHCVRFTADDRTLAAAVKDGSICLWDVPTGILRATIKGHVKRIWQLAFSPDGRTLATVSDDRTLKLWPFPGEQGRRRLLPLLPAPIAAMTFTGNGRQIAAAPERISMQQGSFHVWKTSTGAHCAISRRKEFFPSDPIFSPDGLTSIRTINLQRDDSTHDHLLLATADQWERETPLLLSPPEGGHLVNTVGFSLSPDHRTLAIAQHKGLLRLWDLRSGKELKTLARQLSNDIESMAFDARGQSIAAVTYDGMIKVWDASTGSEKTTLIGPRSAGRSIRFSPDAKSLAVGNADRTLALWDLVAGTQRARLQGHTGDVRSVVFSPDGTTVASGSDDGTVRLWDVRTLQELISLPAQEGGVRVVTFSPDGRTLASGGATRDGKGEIFLWEAGPNGDP